MTNHLLIEIVTKISDVNWIAVTDLQIFHDILIQEIGGLLLINCHMLILYEVWGDRADPVVPEAIGDCCECPLSRDR